MKIQLRELLIMRHRIQRDVFSRKASLFRVNVCAPPSNSKLSKFTCPNERTSLCVLVKGSLTIEAALVLPFFMGVLLTLFSFFSQYTLGTELGNRASIEAQRIGIAVGCLQEDQQGDITILKTGIWEPFPFFSVLSERKVTQKAVCRAWIGFTETEEQETYVYVTPYGSVYHLSRECTHLKLSVQKVMLESALRKKNQYGEFYHPCQRCDPFKDGVVYITAEGNRYHSEKDCSALKRTVLTVALSQVENKSCCIRCVERE